MAKARKRQPESPGTLRGGVGDNAAGRSAWADLVRANARGIAEDDILPPIPANRATETFQTVGDDLTRQMGQNVKDPSRRKSLQDLAESMLAVIDEARRPLAPDEADASKSG